MRFVDTHAHLDDPAFDRDRLEVIGRAIDAGVSRVCNVGYRPSLWRSTQTLAATIPMISPMFGLHPQHADEYSDATMEALERTLRTGTACALGEIGLDFFRNGPPAPIQIDAFATQLRLAQKLNLSAVIHQRAAGTELMRTLDASAFGFNVLLHSFDGDSLMAASALERGYFFGVGGLMTRASSESLRAVLRKVPLERMVLETDSPYLVPRGGVMRRNEPSTIPIVAAALAKLLDVDITLIATQTTLNAERIFGKHLLSGEYRDDGATR